MGPVTFSEENRENRSDPQWLAARIEELSGWRARRTVEVLTDTTEAMNLHRHVLALEELLDDPAAALKDPYGEGWLLRIMPSNFDSEREILGLRRWGGLVSRLLNAVQLEPSITHACNPFG